jgi:tryptophan synthase alpha chain
MNRIDQALAQLRHARRSGLACYFTGGDPSYEDSLALLKAVGAAGADLIEIGIPFSDPVADGPAIQAAHIRARAGGQTLARTLALVRSLRQTDADTPVVLMGYLNPVMQYGSERFFYDASQAGVDGVVLVDLPYEHVTPYMAAAQAVGIHLVRMSAPTSDDERMGKLFVEAGGFIYHVAVTGTTGAGSGSRDDLERALVRVRRHTGLPVAVGFGVCDANQVAALAGLADLIVVGSALVEILAAEGIEATLERVRQLRCAV